MRAIKSFQGRKVLLKKGFVKEEVFFFSGGINSVNILSVISTVWPVH